MPGELEFPQSPFDKTGKLSYTMGDKVTEQNPTQMYNQTTIKKEEIDSMKITNDILYIGVNDHQVDLFEGQ